MGVEKTQPRKAINKKTKVRIVFDENARKDFLTGFRKRKDERRKQWKEKIERQLKNEIKKIKGETKAKLDKGMSKKNSSHQIVPEVAHLINSDLAETTVTECGAASVTITTLDSLQAVVTPWREGDEEKEDTDSESEEEECATEEVPGMSLNPSEVTKVVIGSKEKKAINKEAIKQLHQSKAFKDKEKLKAKKQRSATRWKKKMPSKKQKHQKRAGRGAQ
eukprot:GFUD01019102.1.p1 GENE.GFUD01019102.1~~GFUD01019102.1.p1  ORF type:complete len:220 (-),score=90.49 GFUD01019102.1:55-714(-)